MEDINLTVGGNGGENESEPIPILMNFNTSKSHCIFCTAECPPSFVIDHGKLVRIKREVEPHVFSDDFILDRQLKSMNILRNILDIRGETCARLLGEFEGQLHPEFWLDVCVACKVFVDQYNNARKQIAKWEKEATNLKLGLKSLIFESNRDADPEMELEHFGAWKEIRDEAIIDFEKLAADQINYEVSDDVVAEVDVSEHMIVEEGPTVLVKQEEPTKEQRSMTRTIRVAGPVPKRKRTSRKLDKRTERISEAGQPSTSSLSSSSQSSMTGGGQENGATPGITTGSPEQPNSVEEIGAPISDNSNQDIHVEDPERNQTLTLENEEVENGKSANEPVDEAIPHDKLQDILVAELPFCPEGTEPRAVETEELETMEVERDENEENQQTNSSDNNILSASGNEKQFTPAPTSQLNEKEDGLNKENPITINSSSHQESGEPEMDIQIRSLRGRSKATNSFDGFTKINRTGRASAIRYKCNKCKTTMKSDGIQDHRSTCRYKEVDCTYCGISVVELDLIIHHSMDCLQCPGSRRRYKNAKVVSHYKCKDCSALIKPDEQQLRRHLKLHTEKHSSMQGVVCLVCDWRVENICDHNAKWHSENSLRSNEWALHPNFWVVDDSNPNYTLFKQENISKYKCKRCPAKLFKQEEIEEHVQLNHVDGVICSSCNWFVAAGMLKEHEERHHFPREQDGVSTSKLAWKFTDYWNCGQCGGRFLREDMEEHLELHKSEEGATCGVCGLMVKSQSMISHLGYFHAELGFTAYM